MMLVLQYKNDLPALPIRRFSDGVQSSVKMSFPVVCPIQQTRAKKINEIT